MKVAEVVGSVVERDLLDALFAGRAHLADPVEKHMSPALPLVGGRAGVGRGRRAREGRRRDRRRRRSATGVVTRQDLLVYLAR